MQESENGYEDRKKRASGKGLLLKGNKIALKKWGGAGQALREKMVNNNNHQKGHLRSGQVFYLGDVCSGRKTATRMAKGATTGGVGTCGVAPSSRKTFCGRLRAVNEGIGEIWVRHTGTLNGLNKRSRIGLKTQHCV